MRLHRLVVFSLSVFLSHLVAGQTRWPSYIAELEHDTSEGPVTANLPLDARVTVPPASLTASKVRFSGIWSGWGCQSRICDVKLAVEALSDTAASVIYAGASQAG